MTKPTFHFDKACLIRESRDRAMRVVNAELIELYWEVGKILSRQVEDAGWGRGTVPDLAKHLKHSESGLKGFSASNLWRMRQFNETYRGNEKLAPLVRQLPWSSNLLILGQAKTDEWTTHLPKPQRGARIPAQGETLGIRFTPSPRSEGTPHLADSPTTPRIPSMRRSFRTHLLRVTRSRGCTPGWYAMPRWGNHVGANHPEPRWANHTNANRPEPRWANTNANRPEPQRGIRIPAQGETLGIRFAPSPRSEGTPHLTDSPTTPRTPSMQRSFRTHLLRPACSRGCTPGWYAMPRWGNHVGDLDQPSHLDIAQH